RAITRQYRPRRLLPRIRHRPRRRLRAAAVFPEGQEAGRAGARHLEIRQAGEQGRHQAAHRRGDQIRRARSPLPVAAMRLRLDRGRQRAGRGRAVGEAAHDRGARRRSVGLSMQRVKPPFRADHVGSLLRTAPLKEAREKRARGEISAEELTAIEDREIEGVIRKQEMIGLKSATDGEYRRISWHYDFLERLDNVESYVGERKIKFAASGPQPRPILLRVIGKLGGYKTHPMVEHFKFLKAHAKETPKLTIPSPSSLHFRYGRDAVPESLYPAMDDFYRDLGETYR